MRAIARELGRNVLTISQELARDADPAGRYRPTPAQRPSPGWPGHEPASSPQTPSRRPRAGLAGCTSTPRPLNGRRRGRPRTHGELASSKNPTVGRDELDDHGIGRSRGGLSAKSHALVDGRGRLLTLILGPGQAGNCSVLPLLLS